MSDFESRYRKWHTYMSYGKSAIRIAACSMAISGITGFVGFAALMLAAEIIGIIEEWV